MRDLDEDLLRDLLTQSAQDLLTHGVTPGAVRVRRRRTLLHRTATIFALTAVTITGAAVVVTQQPASHNHVTAGAATAPIVGFSLHDRTNTAAAGSRAYALLVAQAGGQAALTQGWPTFETTVTDDMPLFASQVQWPLGRTQATLKLFVVSATSLASEAPGLAHGTTPCVPKTDTVVNKDGSTSSQVDDSVDYAGCVRTDLPGGALLWTYTERERANSDFSQPAAMLVDERDALLIAPDGSAMRLFLRGGSAPAVPALSDPTLGPSPVQLGELLQRIALAWEG